MFLFRLALQLGYPHPDHLTAQLTSRQLGQWIAYYNIEPFGEYRQELRHGKLMHLLDSVNFKRDKPLAPIDFMDFTERPPEPEAPQETPEQISQRIATELFRLK